MDPSIFVRVRVRFRDNVKVLRLDTAVDNSMRSMAELGRLVFRIFPEIGETVESSSRDSWVAPTVLVDIKCQDSAGGYVTLESDAALQAAVLRKMQNDDYDLDLMIDIVHKRAANLKKVGGFASNSNLRYHPRQTWSRSNTTAGTWGRSDTMAGPMGRSDTMTGTWGRSNTMVGTWGRSDTMAGTRGGSNTTAATWGRSDTMAGTRGRSETMAGTWGRSDTMAGNGSKQARQERPVGVCRHFARGYCKYGPTCRYSHESSNEPTALGTFGRGESQREFEVNRETKTVFQSYKEVDNWLLNQLDISASESIEQLSSAKGRRAISELVEKKGIPDDTIYLLVKVLAKEEFRTSCLRQKTNEIFGTLLGSSFMLQLHVHIENHLGIRTPRPDEIEPYVFLIQELQSRTEGGFKEVPLDKIQVIVSRLPGDSPVKHKLLTIIGRLVEHRERLKWSQAVAQTDNFFKGARFRQMSIVATKEELLTLQAKQDLPVNRVGIRYSRLSDYLETHFLLLREDSIDPLRQGIKAYRSANNDINARSTSLTLSQPRNSQELRIYVEVRYVGVRCGENGIEYALKFDLPQHERQNKAGILWENSKRLMFGALLCISPDNFQTFIWAVVARRDVKELNRGLVGVRLIGHSESNVEAGAEMQRGDVRPHVMVESTAAYFEAYQHVLMSLQREQMEELPFTSYLLDLESHVRPPEYLQRRGDGHKYDFSSAFPKIDERMGSKYINVMSDRWPTGWADSLDVAQVDALKHGLTKELAIIQGPPGTGKTYLGLLLVRILLANLKRGRPDGPSAAAQTPYNLGRMMHDEQEHDMAGPIFIICYTNHALDQFLEGIFLQGEENLIRIGGRSKSALLQGRTLRQLIYQQRLEHNIEGSHRRLYGEARTSRDSLESEVHKCIDNMGLKRVTYSSLDRVATPEQMWSLFGVANSIGASPEQMVELWLEEESSTDPMMAGHFYLYSNVSAPSRSTRDDAYRSEWSPRQSKDDNKSTRGQIKLLPNSESAADADEGWTRVENRRGGRRQLARAPLANNNVPLEENFRDVNIIDEEEVPIHEFVDVPNVWELYLRQRRQLHEYWLREIRSRHRGRLQEPTQVYEATSNNLMEVEKEVQLSLLRKASVVGMTTTSASKHHEVLKSLKPEIIVVEEAAEVLEAHILACLSPSVKHLILIGDHLQLRPSVAVYRHGTEHKLDVSMFERLVRSGVEHVTLQEQRRMRPTVSKLVKSLYPTLRDHESVTEYEQIAGVKQSVFFFDHKAPEEQSRMNETGSKLNITEANLVVELCIYLLSQGQYKPKDIVILSMYTGQLQEIRRILSDRVQSKFRIKPVGQPVAGEEIESELPRVSSVDDFQGEESNIVILSLVRSNAIVTQNGVGKIGFLNVANRICVALTRARKGLYIFGNAGLLAEKSSLWKEVTSELRVDGALGPHLEVYCQRHPTTVTKITRVQDFKLVEDGGCNLPCEIQLDCGHACPRRCHFGSQEKVFCLKSCLTQYADCDHICNRRCHGQNDCPPCAVVVTKELLCKHSQNVSCCTEITPEVLCNSPCEKLLECGHLCTMLCGRPCSSTCYEKVSKLLPCGHLGKMYCHQDAESFCCMVPCETILEDCEHRCQGSCGKCQGGILHVPCQQKCGRVLPCGHLCQDRCSAYCPPCKRKCEKRCAHSKCSQTCGELCIPCREKCAWQCEHHRCEKQCHKICSRPRCNLPCQKVIQPCRHPCIGLCGEPCPKKCRICHAETRETITLMTLGEFEESDRFIQLEDCNHVFEVEGLDTWMDGTETGESSETSAIKHKECPECKTIVRKTHRYLNVVKTRQAQIEEVKKKVFGHELTRQGNLSLKNKNYPEAHGFFRKALQRNPGLIEAHFGVGCACYSTREYEKAITHWLFIIGRSFIADDPTCTNILETVLDEDSSGKTLPTPGSLIGEIGNSHLLGQRFASGKKHVTHRRLIEKCYRRATSASKDPVAIESVLQWASVPASRRQLTDTQVIKLCEAVLRRYPDNTSVAECLKQVKAADMKMIVEVMGADVGGKGHWYTCPNGHYYTIGECGGATQVSKCPDCKATVGGGSHRLAAGNKHSNIDGSTRSAWPGN